MTATSTKSSTSIPTGPTRGPTEPLAGDASVRRPRRWPAIAAASLALVVAAAVLALVTRSGSDDNAQIADVGGQGGEGLFGEDAATLFRRADGLTATLDLAVPTPGTYRYPTGDNVSPWAEPHPPVSPGSRNAPEVFTLWLVVFNSPDRCTEGVCDGDDLATDAAARGGVYQLDGRVADGDRLEFVGTARLGQPPLAGAVLTDPLEAEVHLAIAPHGRRLSGPDAWRQLNGPVGDPSHWWTARFVSP